MLKGDRYILLRTANVEWWDVIYYDFRERPDKRFYVPGKGSVWRFEVNLIFS